MFFFFQAEDGIRDHCVTGVQTCGLPICYRMRPQTMLSPLTGLVDAARPDSEAARQFAANVDAFLSDAPRFAVYRPDLEHTLSDWQSASRALGAMIDRSPALEEARPLANNLS